MFRNAQIAVRMYVVLEATRFRNGIVTGIDFTRFDFTRVLRSRLPTGWTLSVPPSLAQNDL